MGYKLIVSKEAHTDVDQIARYISLDLCNPSAASTFLDRVEKSYRTITENPYLYALCDDKRLQFKGYRKVIINNYLILYRIDEEKKDVYVVRVVYGPREYSDTVIKNS